MASRLWWLSAAVLLSVSCGGSPGAPSSLDSPGAEPGVFIADLSWQVVDGESLPSQRTVAEGNTGAYSVSLPDRQGFSFEAHVDLPLRNDRHVVLTVVDGLPSPRESRSTDAFSTRTPSKISIEFPLLAPDGPGEYLVTVRVEESGTVSRPEIDEPTELPALEAFIGVTITP